MRLTEQGALQKVTRTMPIVFAKFTDPVGGSLVASLAHAHERVTTRLIHAKSLPA
jgi:ABC-type uncharacterized transport system substrate-binding protein